MKLSAIIIAKNEANTIARALRSVSFCDERIVVDAESTDGTAALAEQLGARVFIRPWPGYGAQKNFGAEQARGDWLLFIDADEEVTPDLRAAIMAAMHTDRYPVYWLRIVTWFLRRPLRHLYGHNPRLFRKSAARWTAASVHEQVVLNDGTPVKLGDTASGLIAEPLQHHSHATVRAYLNRMHRYTTLDAKEMQRTGRHRGGQAVRPSPLLPWRLAAKQLFKLLIYRRGLLDGWPGIVWSFLSAYYEWEMARKYLHRQSS